jgi:hypothetical protein
MKKRHPFTTPYMINKLHVGIQLLLPHGKIFLINLIHTYVLIICLRFCTTTFTHLHTTQPIKTTPGILQFFALIHTQPKVIHFQKKHKDKRNKHGSSQRPTGPNF